MRSSHAVFISKNVCARADVITPGARRMRLWLLMGAALTWSAAVLLRLFSLQVAHKAQWQEWALKQHFARVTIASERGPIYDRGGQLLAVSVPAGSVYVRPGKVQDRERTVRDLSGVLGMAPAAIRRKLASSQPFVWVARQIPKVTADRAAALKLPGVDYLLEAKRYYPYNEAASTLIGKVGIDGGGLSGIEAAFDRELRGEEVRHLVVRDALGHAIQDPGQNVEDFKIPRGAPLSLTIDAALQTVVSQELEDGRRKANAKAAMSAVIDAETGEILAMAQSPAPNFNLAGAGSRADLHNRVVEMVFEPGSIMKPIVAAAAIEWGLITPEEILDCEGGRFSFAGHAIRDVHPYGRLSLADVVVRSSNIGMTKVGMRLGSERLYRSLKAFGFGQECRLRLPGETGGILRDRRSWAAIDVATHAFGQGVAVTPLQMVRAVAAIANGGSLPALSILADGGRPPAARVLSHRTAAVVREMMYRVVEDEHGTGRKAAVAGVRIGGKTGTAQKARAGARGYAGGLYAASFVGFADGAELGVPQQLVAIVVIDEPHGGSIYGGALAAPVFKRIMQRSLHLLATRSQVKGGPAPEHRDPAPAAEDGFVLASFRY